MARFGFGDGESTVQVLGGVAAVQDEFDKVLTAIEDGDCPRARKALKKAETEAITESNQHAGTLRRQVDRACPTGDAVDGLSPQVIAGALGLAAVAGALWFYFSRQEVAPPPSADAFPPPIPLPPRRGGTPTLRR